MVIMQMLFVLVTACFCILHAHPVTAEEGHYVNQFLVELHKRETAEDVARDYGFEIEDDIPGLGFVVLRHKDVSHRSKRSAVDYINKLKFDSRVKYADQEKELIREKREIIHDKQIELPIKKITDNSIYYRVQSRRIVRKDGIPNPEMRYNDPYYGDQWYIHNDGQTGGEVDVDLNVVLAWKYGYVGRGINVCILDDGIDHTHPDLRDSYRADLSTDMNDRGDSDPMPDTTNSDNSHGTRCAGEIVAKANNKNCGVGVAHGANIGGVRILDGPITDSLEGKALNFKNQDVHIYSASWGPRDDGATLEAPGEATRRAIERGVKEGRGQKGSIFIWASGNGGGNDDDCNCDGYVGMPETISIGSITDRGMTPYFMEVCTSTMAVVPSGGEESLRDEGFQPKIRVVTTDLDGGCTENFEGTSAAAPLAAGVVALVLEANQDLTWRDVQHIIAKGSRIPAVTDDWVVNGAGYHRSHKFGFGVMDASLMVELAIGWENVPEANTCNSSTIDVNKDVPAGNCVTEFVNMSFCQEDHNMHIERIEHTLLYVEIDTDRRGDVSITLTSPYGTISQMLSTRRGDNSREGIRFQFLSLNNFGENVVGENLWKIEVCDNNNEGSHMTLNRYWLVTMGTSDHPNTRSTDAFQPSKAAVAEMKELELRRGKRVNLKRNSDGLKKSTKQNKIDTTEEEEDENQQKYLKDVIHDISSYLQRKGFQENHVIDILNHGMAYSSKVKKEKERKGMGLSRRTFGEEEINHDRFIDGMSKAVGNIFQEREKERKEILRRQQEKREELAEEYIEDFIDRSEDFSDEAVDRVLRNVRNILQNRK